MQTRRYSTKAITGALFLLAMTQALPAAAAPFAAVLPSSRSVQTGTVATAFATILNPDGEAAENCSITPATEIDADFFYQTTDSATNEVTGSLNTPVTIPAGGSQAFVFGFTPTATFGPTTVEFNFTCSTGTAPSAIGINTLLLSGNSTPVADVCRGSHHAKWRRHHRAAARWRIRVGGPGHHQRRHRCNHYRSAG